MITYEDDVVPKEVGGGIPQACPLGLPPATSLGIYLYYS